MTVRILTGPVVDVLAALEPKTFQVCVTSPPYWKLRAYGTEPQVWPSPDGDALCAPEQHEWGEYRERWDNRAAAAAVQGLLPGKRTHHDFSQPDRTRSGAFCAHCFAWRGELGQEPTPELYVAHLVACFQAVRRVLRDDGTLWCNIAGAYYNDPGGQNGSQGTVSAKAVAANGQNGRHVKPKHPWLKPLDWVDIPGMFARAMQEDGWIWRSDVVWVKPSALPESVSGTRWERCRVKVAAGPTPRRGDPLDFGGYPAHGHGTDGGPTGGTAEWADCPGCPGCAPHEGYVLRRGNGRPTKSTERILLFIKCPGAFFDTEAVREAAIGSPQRRSAPKLVGRRGAYQHLASTVGVSRDEPEPDVLPDGGRNLRDWWVLSPEPLADAHYAAYPTALPERCIKAGTSEWGCCPACGAPWARVVQTRSFQSTSRTNPTPEWGRSGKPARGPSDEVPRPINDAEVTTLAWRPTCRCQPEQPPVPCRVLDCFGGSGATALAANRLGRDCTLVELKAAYADLARKRLAREPLSLFASHGQQELEPVGEAPARLETTKQEQHPNRTVAGFNQRWKAKQEAML